MSVSILCKCQQKNSYQCEIKKNICIRWENSFKHFIAQISMSKCDKLKPERYVTTWDRMTVLSLYQCHSVMWWDFLYSRPTKHLVPVTKIVKKHKRITVYIYSDIHNAMAWCCNSISILDICLDAYNITKFQNNNACWSRI